MDQSIPEGVRQFVLTSTPSVLHLETLLLLLRRPRAVWNAQRIACHLIVVATLQKNFANREVEVG